MRSSGAQESVATHLKFVSSKEMLWVLLNQHLTGNSGPGHSGDERESPDGHQGLGVLLGQISCHHPDCCPQIPHQNSISEAALSCWQMFQELATLEGAAGATRMGGAAAGRSLTQDSLCSGLFRAFTGIYTLSGSSVTGPYQGVC